MSIPIQKSDTVQLQERVNLLVNKFTMNANKSILFTGAFNTIVIILMIVILIIFTITQLKDNTILVHSDKFNYTT